MGIGNSFLLNGFSDAVWAIKPERLQIMADVIIQKVDSGSLNALTAKETDYRSNAVQFVGDVAILNVEGVLVPKASWLDSICGMSGTVELHNTFNQLVENPQIRRIVVYLNTPGGAVIGIPEFAKSIYDARSKKEIVGFTDIMACSAGQYLLSACEQRIATPSAMVGSIGVYSTLVKNNEVKSQDGQILNKHSVHIIQAGSKKTFGHPDIPISQEEIDYFSEMVMGSYNQFTSDVAEFSGVTQEEVKSTEAAFYDAKDAPSWMLTELNTADYAIHG